MLESETTCNGFTVVVVVVVVGDGEVAINYIAESVRLTAQQGVVPLNMHRSV